MSAKKPEIIDAVTLAKKNASEKQTQRRGGKGAQGGKNTQNGKNAQNKNAQSGKNAPESGTQRTSRKGNSAKSAPSKSASPKAPSRKKGAKQQNPPKKPRKPIRISFLGGLNEIGKNMTVYEYDGDMFIVDCGLAFPDADMYGVDMVIPDFTYIEQNKSRVRGVMITHGHEDHIGALP